MIYIVVALILIYFTYVHDILRVRGDAYNHYIWVFIILFSLAGLRLGIGGDTYQYRIFWDLLPTWDNFKWSDLTVFRYNMGWVMLCFILKSMFGTFIALQLVLSFLIHWGIFKIAKKYSRYPFLIILMLYLCGELYFHLVFTFIRQSASVAVFLIWGIGFLERKKYLHYYTIVALSASLHYSGLLLAIMPFFWEINYLSRKKLLSFFVAAVALFIVLILLYDSNLMTSIRILDRINNGIDNFDDEAKDTGILRFVNATYTIIPYYVVILYGFFCYHLDIKLKGVVLFGAFICIVTPFFNDSKRFIYYIIIFLFVSVARVFARYIRYSGVRYIIVIVTFTFFTNLLFYKRYVNPENTFMFYPYISCFEDEPSSHFKYMNFRMRDGHTISHQIYDYNKMRKK